MPRITKAILEVQLEHANLTIREKIYKIEALKAKLKGSRCVVDHINTLSMNIQRLGDALVQQTCNLRERR